MSMYDEVPIAEPEVKVLRRRIHELEAENARLKERLIRQGQRPSIFGKFIQNQIDMERINDFGT